MREIDIEEAQANWEALVDRLQSGREAAIVLTRNGRPAAMLVPPRSEESPGRH